MAERLNPYPEGVPDELTIVVTEATTRTSRLTVILRRLRRALSMQDTYDELCDHVFKYHQQRYQHKQALARSKMQDRV